MGLGRKGLRVANTPPALGSPEAWWSYRWEPFFRAAPFVFGLHIVGYIGGGATRGSIFELPDEP